MDAHFALSLFCTCLVMTVSWAEDPTKATQTDQDMCIEPSVCDECCEKSLPYKFRFYGTAEYLRWRVQSYYVPQLIGRDPPFMGSTRRIGDQFIKINFTDGGALITDFIPESSRPFIGNGQLDGDLRDGGRYSAGVWLGECRRIALEVEGFLLDTQKSNIQAVADRNSTLDVALIDPLFPDMHVEYFIERARLSTFSDLWGYEANGCLRLADRRNWNLDLLAGYRHVHLKEGLSLTTQSTGVLLDNNFGVVRLNTADSFEASNDFHGGQIGLQSRLRLGAFSVDVRGKLAFGNLHNRIDIQGSTTRTDATNNVTILTGGGIFAQPTNIGRYERDQLTVVPEVGVTLGWNIGERLRVFGGYSAMWICSGVARPGSAIDGVVDPAFVPVINNGVSPPIGPNSRPAFQFNEGHFKAYGTNAGIELRF